MFDMGFLPDVRRIIHAVPNRAARRCCSRPPCPMTSGRWPLRCCSDPLTVQIGHAAPVETVSHAVYPVAQHLKTPLLIDASARHRRRGSVLVFTRTKHRAKRLAEQLQRAGFRATSIQGNLSQNPAPGRAGWLPVRQVSGPGRHRHRGARHRRDRYLARDQLRHARYHRRLYASHRPYRPCRADRRGFYAGDGAKMPARCALSSGSWALGWNGASCPISTIGRLPKPCRKRRAPYVARDRPAPTAVIAALAMANLGGADDRPLGRGRGDRSGRRAPDRDAGSARSGGSESRVGQPDQASEPRPWRRTQQPPA